MSLEGHIVELQRRHEALKKEVQQARSRKSSDDAELLELKRKKLLLKDELEKLRQQETRH
jgi:hypothetical protein